MLKKLGIVGVAAATLTLGAAGVAFAGDYDHDHGDHSHHRGDHEAGVNCSSHERTEQYNSGHQVVGGNVIGRDINGFWGGSADKVAICPSVGNNNKFF
jgi:hypothetical protein